MPKPCSAAKSPICLLLVAPEMYPWRADGVTQVVRGLSNALAEQECLDISVVATLPSGANPYEAGYSRRIRFYPVRKRWLPEPFYHLYLQFSYALALLSWACCHRGCRRVVHFEILPGTRAGLAAVVAILAGVSRLVTIHGWPSNEISLERRVLHRLGYLGHWGLARLLLCFFPILIVNSHYIRRQAASSFQHHVMYVLPNGIDWTYWSEPQNVGRPPIAALASWGKVESAKGIWVLLDAWVLLAAHDCTNSIALYLAGVGSELPLVRQWIVEHDLQKRVILLGEQRHHEIRNLAGSVAIAVFPSPIEAFGIAALEAMAAGKPVIVADRAGSSELVRPGETGLWFHSGDPEHLAAIISNLMASSSLQDSLGKAAQASARHFDWQQVALPYVALYGEVAA